MHRPCSCQIATGASSCRVTDSGKSTEEHHTLEGLFDRISLDDPGDIARLERGFNASPQLQRLGFEVDLADPDRPRCHIREVQDYHRGGVGLPAVNGGISSALCDLSIGVTGLKYLDRGRIATARLDIRFLQPLIAKSVTATAYVRVVRDRRLFAVTELANESGIVCVRAKGVVVTGIRKGAGAPPRS